MEALLLTATEELNLASELESMGAWKQSLPQSSLWMRHHRAEALTASLGEILKKKTQ